MARRKGLSFYKKKKKINFAIVREIISWLCGMLIACFVAVVVVYFMGMIISVVGVSMEPVVYNEQKVLVNRFVYVLSTPKAGDVVVFLPNGNENAHYYVKRVVAVPGDEVLIEGGALYVNGKKCDWAVERILDPGIAENPLTMEKGEYFCMGDNANVSEDSRSANVGPVKSTDIVGKVWFRMAYGNAKLGFVK